MGGEATRSRQGSQGSTPSAGALTAALASSLRTEIEGSRWFQGKGRTLSSLRLADRIPATGSGGGVVAIVTAIYADGAEEEYAVPVCQDGTGAVRGAGSDDPVWPALSRLALDGGTIEGDHGAVEGRPGPLSAGPLEATRCRLLEADQSNTSVILDGRLVLKCYRRLWPGPHPEQELLAGLTRVGSARAPSLLGAITYRGDDTSVALATAYAYVEGAAVGWEPAIGALTDALGGPPAGLACLAQETAPLGHCAGELHRDLLAAFGGRRGTHAEARKERQRAVAGVDEAVDAVGQVAPELAALGPVSHLELAALDRLDTTPLQRLHGDLHVGQLLRSPAGVVAIDFEGDPTLLPALRSRMGSPLQDVASLLLSLDHVAAAAARRRGFGAATAEAFDWSTRAREAVLAAYEEASPPGAAGDPSLLRALEVEKEWREAVYAARVLPEWLYAPRLVLLKLLA